MKYKFKKTVFSLIVLLLLISFTACNITTNIFDNKSAADKEYHTNSNISQNTNTIEKDPMSAIGIDESNPEDFNTISKTGSRLSPHYEAIELTFGYNSLQSDAQREFYGAISESVYNVSDSKNDNGKYPIERIHLENYSLSEADIRVTLEAFSCDNPYIFWLANLFGYVGGSSTTIQMYSEFSPSEIEQSEKELDTVISSLLSEIPGNLDQFERELYIHDFLVNKCTYAKNVKTLEDDRTAFSIYGALVKEKAVCEGYAKTMQYILSRIGIESITVNGKSKNQLHKWNIVNINNKWYHLDATWDDNDDVAVYNYFNVDDSTIENDHTICKNFTDMSDDEICNGQTIETDFFNLGVPVCSDMDENFYNIKGTNLYGFDEQSDLIVTTALYNAAEKEETSFYIKVDKALDFDAVVQQLFYQEPYKFFEYIDAVNGDISSVKLERSVSMVSDPKQRTIQILLKYVN